MSNFKHDRMDIELEETTLAHDFYGTFSLLNNFNYPTFYTDPRKAAEHPYNNPPGYQNIDAGFASGFH